MTIFNNAYLSLGSNIGDSKQHLINAVEQIKMGIGEVNKCSSLYSTKPLPTPSDIEQGDFFNIVIEITTALKPLKLLYSLLEIEKRLGRVREEDLRWGPRIIDIDIILYQNLSLIHI